MPDSATPARQLSSTPRVHYVEGVAVTMYSAQPPALYVGGRPVSSFRVLATLHPLDPNEPEIGRSEKRARQKALESPPKVAVIATGLSLHGAVHVAQDSLRRPLNPSVRPTTTWVEEVL